MSPFKSKNKKSAVVSVTSTRKPSVPELKTPEPPPQVEPKEQRLATLTLILKELNEVVRPH